MFTYQIGDVIYTQKELVNGQVKQLLLLIKDMVIPKTFTAEAVGLLLGDNIFKALAIVLQREDFVKGKSRSEIVEYLRTRDIDAIAFDLEWMATPLDIAQVIEDFFDCNPILSLLEKFAAIGMLLKVKAEAMKLADKVKTGSTQSVSSSPMVMSPSETISCGAIPSESVDLT